MGNYRIVVWTRDPKYTGQLIEEKVYILQASSKGSAISEMDRILHYLGTFDSTHVKKVEKVD